jgi:retinol-binding protein 3
MVRRLKVLLVVIASAATAWAEPAIPATPAGRVLAAWLDAFNSGDRAKIDAFLKNYAPRLPQPALTSAHFRGQSGGLTLIAVTRSDQNLISFRVQEKSQPTILIGKMEVTATKAPTIQNFALSAVPEGAVLEDIKLDAPLRKQIIADVVSNLDQFYVYPELAKKMGDAIRAREGKGDYKGLTGGDEFASQLTADLLAVSHDKHLNVFYVPYKFAADPPPLTLDRISEDRRAMARDCGIRNVEIRPNNIGYMKLDFFADPMACGKTAAAAITFLANTDAVIFDVRENSGGDPRMVALIASYLFDQPVHLNDFYDRTENKTSEYWTLRFVPGLRIGHKPAYVLTSGRSFSGAEEFAYDLKNLRRVTVVGETTAGASHPVGPHKAGDHFIVYVPNARSISPVTKTDWEGKGVAPDVAVSADEALDTAERLAAERIQLEAGRATPAPRAD